MGDPRDELRRLPAVDRIADALGADTPHVARVAAARAAVEAARAAILKGAPAPDPTDVIAAGREFLRSGEAERLRPVINATGVLIHTNLGRVPLGDHQLDAVRRIAASYSNLEFDLASGHRGDRYHHARRALCSLTGAGSALVVNNNAAAVLITLAALCKGREVVISRGELIEIGGEFRIPDVMAESGARLVEVGTTNRTHPSDYANAIGDNTAAILKVHPSNYRVVGFTAEVPARRLAELAHERGIYLIHDLGSGLLPQSSAANRLVNDPPVDVALGDGADIVTFSGDKLLGGPQAGIIAGRSEPIEAIARHPLLRALRVDKMTLAALEATLDLYLRGREAELPLWRMALVPLEQLEERAHEVARRVHDPTDGCKVEAVATSAVPGGGSAPGSEIPSWAVAVTHAEISVDEIAAGLRAADPPVIGRIESDRLLLDLRTVPADRDEDLISGLAQALRP